MRHCIQLISLVFVAAVFAVGCQPEVEPTVEPPAELELEAEVAVQWLNPETIVFASTPHLGEGLITDEFQPFVGYLTEQLGRPTRLRNVESYEKMIQLIESKEVHLGVLSPLSYVRAKKLQPGLRLLASQVANGATTYSAYMIARTDSGISDIQGLKGKRFGFVDKLSTSGYLYPMAELKGLGIEPDTFFSEVVYAGDHEKLIEWVLEGKVDAGATSSSAFNIIKSKVGSGQSLTIIGKSGRIPYDAVVANARLAPALVERAQKAILSLSTQNAAGREVLSGPTNINGFVPAQDNLYTDVRRALTLLGE